MVPDVLGDASTGFVTDCYSGEANLLSFWSVQVDTGKRGMALRSQSQLSRGDDRVRAAIWNFRHDPASLARLLRILAPAACAAETEASA